jgi:hypothetical protein
LDKIMRKIGLFSTIPLTPVSAFGLSSAKDANTRSTVKDKIG